MVLVAQSSNLGAALATVFCVGVFLFMLLIAVVIFFGAKAAPRVTPDGNSDTCPDCGRPVPPLGIECPNCGRRLKV